MKTYIVQAIEKTPYVKIKFDANSKAEAILRYQKFMKDGNVDRLDYAATYEFVVEEEDQTT